MSLSRNGYAVSTRRGSLGVLFSALLALALFDPGAATAQEAYAPYGRPVPGRPPGWERLPWAGG